MSNFAVESILKELNAESGRNIRSFLDGNMTEEELKKQSVDIKERYYNMLVNKGVIKPSEEEHRRIVEQGKAMPLAVKTAIKCKNGEITWGQLVNVCTNEVLPIARQEAGN